MEESASKKKRTNVISPHGEGTKGERGERLVAGAKVSHAIGEGERRGYYLSGFHHAISASNGAGWNATGAGKAGNYPMP